VESRLIAALDRMLRNPTRYRLALFAGQRVRSAEVVVEMINGRPLVVLHSVFNIWTFKNNGTLVPPLRDRPVRARAELALALDSPDPRAIVAEASTLASMTGHTASPLTPDANYQSSHKESVNKALRACIETSVLALIKRVDLSADAIAQK
jgi:hypothetical protein